MATSMLELGVGTGKWDAGLKKAKQSLDNFTQANGGLQQALEKESQKMQKFVQMMGQMDSTAKTAKGQMNDYKATIEQLTMQYNRMSEAQKKTIGQDYLNSIDQIKEKFRQAKAEMEGINKSLGDMKMPDMKGGGFLSGIGDKMSGMLQVFGGNLMTKGAGMLAGLASEMGDMVKQGVELAKQGEGIRIAFERLGRGDILDGLREATHGTVTDIELMKAAVKFNDFKLPLDELGTMLAFAQQKAKDTGQSVDYMVDSIVTGLGRKSLMILDNLGLSATEVKDKMAETGDMTKAVGAIIREQMAKAGDYVETAADRAAQANVSLQNKMEELGRKFAPLEEASNSLWTSMKIGILDLVGGPLTDLLNKLTQAGRMANAYGLLGGSSKVGRLTSNLSNASEGNRQSIYQQQQAQFWRYINPREQMIKDIRAWQRGERGNALSSRVGAITEKYGMLDATKIQAEVDAAKKMLADYQKAAQQILSPVKADIDTKGAEQNVESLKMKLIELEAQRKKAIAAGDTDLSKNLAKQISQTKADIKGLGGTTTTRTTTTPKTEEQQNQTRIAELVKQYQNLATAAKTADDAQKAGLTERMTKIQGEIKKLQDRNTELKKFADDARQVQFPIGSLPQLNEQLKTLQTEQAKALDAKQWQDYQRQIEQTQYQIDALKGKWQDGLQATFKLNIEQHGSTDINTAKPDDIAVTFRADDSDVLAKLRVIKGITIDDKTMTVTVNTADAYNQVQQLLKSVDGKTVTFAVQPKMETGTSIQNDAGISGYITSIKQQLETADYGTSLYNGLSAQLADMTTLQNLVGASLKAGLGTAMFDAADATGKDFWTRAMEGGVEDTDWQAIVEKINEALKAAGLSTIKLDFTTGSVSSSTDGQKKNPYLSRNEDGKQELKLNDAVSGIAGGIQNMVGSLQSLGVELPKGLTDVLGGIQAVTSLLSAIMSIVTVIQAITAADAVIPFAGGGIVPRFAGGGLIGKAALGMTVPGHSYSGDLLRLPVDGGRGMIGVNSGEVILNQAQAGVLESELSGSRMRDIKVYGEIQGENIVLSANRYLRRTGQGELVTWGL